MLVAGFYAPRTTSYLSSLRLYTGFAAAFLARQVPTNVRMRRGRLGKAARRDITLQPIRVWWYVFTSHGFSTDSDAATPRQTQTDNDASGNPQRVAGRLLAVPYGIAARRCGFSYRFLINFHD